MLTSIALVVLLVFMIWPESKVKLESIMKRKTPKLYMITFRSVERYHSDVARRYPELSKHDAPR